MSLNGTGLWAASSGWRFPHQEIPADRGYATSVNLVEPVQQAGAHPVDLSMPENTLVSYRHSLYYVNNLGFQVRLIEGTKSCAMSICQEIRAVSSELSTPDLLRFLISKRFAGETLVTASLKAPSVAVLKMVADIDPATPVVFCVPGFQFPESSVYRERIVKLLGLKNVSQSKGGEAEIQPGDHDHSERMWAEHRDLPSRSFEIVHLNKTLAPYSCWISAVYHEPRSPHVTHRVDVQGRLIRVDPLIRWNKEDVGAFMREHKLPFHPRAVRRQPAPPPENLSLPADYHY